MKTELDINGTLDLGISSWLHVGWRYLIIDCIIGIRTFIVPNKEQLSFPEYFIWGRKGYYKKNGNILKISFSSILLF